MRDVARVLFFTKKKLINRVVYVKSSFFLPSLPPTLARRPVTVYLHTVNRERLRSGRVDHTHGNRNVIRTPAKQKQIHNNRIISALFVFAHGL